MSDTRFKAYKTFDIQEMHVTLDIRRKWFSARTTIGELYVNNKFFCYTLEDTIRAEGIKVNAETGIPAGNYLCELSFSTRFQRILPMIYTEPNKYELKNGGISFSGIRFHGGNNISNTEGCVLVAYKKIDANTIQGTAEKDLVKLLGDYTSITVNVTNEQI